MLADCASHRSNDAILFTFTGHAFSPFEFRTLGLAPSFESIILILSYYDRLETPNDEP